MSELAQDLSLALEESSKAVELNVRRHNRKRKGKNRRPGSTLTEAINLHSLEFPNRSEASAHSDPDHVLINPLELMLPEPRSIVSTPTHTIVATTDSEDQCSKITNKLSALCLPATGHTLVSGADPESDSMTEISPERKSTAHARRRRRAKLNPSPQPVSTSCMRDMCVTPEHDRKKPRPHTRKSSKEASAMDTDTITLSKRKRKSQRRQSESPMQSQSNGLEDVYDNASESSFLTSEGELTCDDQAGEADDEQSDFFHEPESTSQGARWWDETGPREQFHRLLSGPYSSHMSSKRTLLGKYGRPFRTGRRRLKHSTLKKPSVPQESSSDSIFCPPPLKNSYPDKEAKRRRKLVPPHFSGSHLSSFVRIAYPGRDNSSQPGRRRRRAVITHPPPDAQNKASST